MAGLKTLVDRLVEPFDDLWFHVREGRRADSVGFDRDHGTDTARFTLGGYEPTRPVVIAEALDAVPIPAETATFVDLGAGKGRVLLLASLRSYARVIGVEVSEPLQRVAVANAHAFAVAHPDATPVEIYWADATGFALPKGPLVLFAYNPFGADVLADVLGRVDGPAALVYVNPLHRDAVAAAGFTQVHRGGPDDEQGFEVWVTDAGSSRASSA